MPSIKFFSLKGLRRNRTAPSLYSLSLFFLLIVCRYENDRDGVSHRGQFALELKSAHPRHLQIREQTC